MERKSSKYVWLLTLLLTGMLAVGCSDKGGEEPQDPPTPEQPGDDEGQGDESGVSDPDIPEHSFLMGSLFGFERDIRNGAAAATGGTEYTTYYNRPLYEAGSDFQGTDDEWWDNLVEEYLYSGLDYMVPNCRGLLPKGKDDPRYYTDHGDPTHIAKLIAALERRGTDELKIAIFDDAPASWAAARNLDLYGSYVAPMGNAASDRYPIEDLDEIYKYIWDYNIKLAFENFYGENAAYNKYLLRFDGKPVLFIWSPNGFLNVPYGGVMPDCTGHLKAILDKIHADFLAEFGEPLFICVDKAFRDRDPMVTKEVVEAMNDWFTASEQTPDRCSYTLRTLNGVSVGVGVPGFLSNDLKGDRMLFDANHGQTLTEALDYFVRYGADLVFLEGFTDMYENAAYWRSIDTKYYDFPNQRLNLLRKYNSTKAYPQQMRVEAEACDYYEDLSTGNSGGTYREGDLDVKKCVDGFNGWCVTDTEAGEWLRWVELPFRAGTSQIVLRYAAQEPVEVRFDVGGAEGEVVTLPATGGEWASEVAATLTFEQRGWREVVLHVVSGTADLNCFTIEAQE